MDDSESVYILARKPPSVLIHIAAVSARSSGVYEDRPPMDSMLCMRRQMIGRLRQEDEESITTMLADALLVFMSGWNIDRKSV